MFDVLLLYFAGMPPYAICGYHAVHYTLALYEEYNQKFLPARSYVHDGVEVSLYGDERSPGGAKQLPLILLRTAMVVVYLLCRRSRPLTMFRGFFPCTDTLFHHFIETQKANPTHESRVNFTSIKIAIF